MSTVSYASIGAGDNGNAPIAFTSAIVHDPEVRGNRFNSYQVYHITTVPATADNIFRRYSDFVWLSETLTAFYPGVFIPAIPPKKLFGKSEEFLIRHRRPALQRFLNRVMSIPILAESAAFQMFLSRTHTYDDGQNEIKKLLNARTVPQILSAYQHYYGDSLAQPLPPTCDQDIIALQEFLKTQKDSLTELSDNAERLAASVGTSVTLLNKITASAQQLNSGEQSYANLPNPSRIPMIDAFNQWHVDLKEAEGAYTNCFYNQFAHELEDTIVMIDLLAEREKIRSKYDKSKTKSSKWSLPTTKCDTEKQRVQREADIKAEEEENVLLDAVTKVVLFEQFKSMWSNKVTEYNQNMSSFAASEANYAQRGYQNWNSVNSQ